MKKFRILALAMVCALALLGAIFLPGSQPGQGRTLSGPSNCGCHGGVDPNTEPLYNWQGSMMAQAARDPLFYGALDIANYDVPDVGEFCLRCHAPNAYLNGRVTPPGGVTDGSNLTGDDWEGVFCDFCHAFVDPLSSEGQSLVDPDVVSYGMGMYVITEGTERRGPYGYLDGKALPKHDWQQSPFHRGGNICGVCHDVSNPTNCDALDPYNTQKCFPVERTYSEWKNSYYATQGEYGNCQYCHMPYRTGKAAKQGDIRDTSLYDGTNDEFVPVHEFAGGNTWAPRAVSDIYGTGVNQAALLDSSTNARLMLQSGASVDVFDQTDSGPGLISVRVTNHAGHKLPTGYPEGRRMWINVVGYDALGSVVWESGAYDGSSALLIQDAQIKIYQAEPGIDSGNGCEPTFHFVLNSCIHSDNRIPPRGFTNAAFSAVRAEPVNYTYADGQYWDDTPYSLPADVASVDVSLYYQTASYEYVNFLSTAPGSSVRGATLLSTYNATGKSTPELMAAATLVIDSDTDGLGDAWENAYFGNLDQGPTDNPDGDGCDNLTEYQGGSDPLVSDCGVCPDNDGDGHADSACGGDDCDDSNPDVYPGAPELCDGIDNQCPGDSGYGSVDEGCPVDTDHDGLPDAIESLYCTSPTNPDSDGDGLCDGNLAVGSTCAAGEDLNADGVVDPGETDPCNPDTDGDGLDDGAEAASCTSGTSWDSDGDGLPDGYEYSHAGDSPPLDGCSAADGGTDFDGDGNSNLNEYYNGTDPWTWNPTGEAGCFYWGEGGVGNGIIGPEDVAEMKAFLVGGGGYYGGVIPPAVDVQDMSGDDIPDPGDVSILNNMILAQSLSSVGSRPTSIEVLDAPGATVQVGMTTHVSVQLLNENGTHTSGFGVIFKVGAGSTGSATILGGDGASSGGRYDVTGLKADGAAASVVLRINSAGTIYVEASTPVCGTGVIGKSAAALSLSTPITVVGQ